MSEAYNRHQGNTDPGKARVYISGGMKVILRGEDCPKQEWCVCVPPQQLKFGRSFEAPDGLRIVPFAQSRSSVSSLPLHTPGIPLGIFLTQPRGHVQKFRSLSFCLSVSICLYLSLSLFLPLPLSLPSSLSFTLSLSPQCSSTHI